MSSACTSGNRSFRIAISSPGDTFQLPNVRTSTVNLVLKTDVTAKKYREISDQGEQQEATRAACRGRAQRLSSNAARTRSRTAASYSTTWLNDEFEPVKSEIDIPGLGHTVMYPVHQGPDARAGASARRVDIGLSHSGALCNSRILQPHESTSAVYRVTVRNHGDVASAFSRDDRQTVKNVRGNTFDLYVKASRVTKGEMTEKEPGAEFLQSSYFINSEDAKVRELARRAVGNEIDPWRKALRIEKWVNANMRSTNHEALATADHVARTLEGDCTEYSMLAAAMCRAEGVPSRTAMGLIYADVKGAPCFAFHMWTEVWVKGRWIPIDATLGKGYVGATHLKVNDSSWHDERTMTPIFPLIRIVGQLSIDVLSREQLKGDRGTMDNEYGVATVCDMDERLRHEATEEETSGWGDFQFFHRIFS